jgi:hypothetical protein
MPKPVRADRRVVFFEDGKLRAKPGPRTAAKDRAGLESSLRRYLRRLQRQPEWVRAFFRAPTIL